MKLSHLQSRLHNLMLQRNSALSLAAGLLALCMLQVVLCFYLGLHQKMIIVPAVANHSFWISEEAVSPEYLSEMSLFFADLRLNVTPSSVDSQTDLLLRYTDPTYYGALKNELVSERDRIINQHVSTAFYPVDVKVDIKALSVVMTGDLLTSVGNSQLPLARVAYLIHFRYDNARLMVDQFQEVKPHV